MNPTLGTESLQKARLVICPRCYSERTRPATVTARMDAFFRWGGLTPHRCRSCSHRFYKRGVPAPQPPLDDAKAEAHTAETVETR